jgi:hypothetical protein
MNFSLLKMDESRSMLNALLYSIITEFLKNKPNNIPKLARRLLPVVANENMSEEKKSEIIQRIYEEHFQEDREVIHNKTPL